jgi:hypothetical protein
MAVAAFAVTTRSRLRGVRFFPLMFVASGGGRRQLAQTPGCLRWASIIAGPQEFWTITVWESRDKMMDFMRSGPHEDIMWLFGSWLRSFWLMRWRFTTTEVGSWDGVTLAADAPTAPPARTTTAGDRETLDAALDAFPRLKAAAADHGAPTYDTAPAVRRWRQAVKGAVAVAVRVEAPSTLRSPAAWLDVRRLRRAGRKVDGCMRIVSGVGKHREHYLLAVLRNLEAAETFLADPCHHALQARWGAGFWSMRWDPANEFGHWDDLRLRKERLGTAIPVPAPAAAAAATGGSKTDKAAATRGRRRTAPDPR